MDSENLYLWLVSWFNRIEGDFARGQTTYSQYMDEFARIVDAMESTVDKSYHHWIRSGGSSGGLHAALARWRKVRVMIEFRDSE